MNQKDFPKQPLDRDTECVLSRGRLGLRRRSSRIQEDKCKAWEVEMSSLYWENRREARVPGEVLDTNRQNEAGEGIELAVIQQLWWPEEEPGFHHETSKKPLEATAVETS